VDEFYDDNEGLIIAEIELSSEEETFIKPDWLAVEVTNDKRYYNSYLSTNHLLHGSIISLKPQ
jgi:adenylate cyclase